MAVLADYVEIVENNMECVILKVKPDSRMGLIALGCFSGNEEMMRLTKGETQTCTIFYKDGDTFSWQWGSTGHTLVSVSTDRCGRMIQNCLEEDFDICIAGDRKAVADTLYIRNIRDSRGKEQEYRLMWFRESEVCIHKNGNYLKHINGLEKAKAYVYGRLDVKNERLTDAPTGCKVLTITGTRK